LEFKPFFKEAEIGFEDGVPVRRAIVLRIVGLLPVQLLLREVVNDGIEV
jgi:hypothetical protein